jgi:SET domain-containing protein
VPRCVA